MGLYCVLVNVCGVAISAVLGVTSDNLLPIIVQAGIYSQIRQTSIVN